MNFFKNAAWYLAFKSSMITIRDHSRKLEEHLERGHSLSERAGAFGSAEVYAERLETELFRLRDMANMNYITVEQYNEAAGLCRRAFELYREIKARPH